MVFDKLRENYKKKLEETSKERRRNTLKIRKNIKIQLFSFKKLKKQRSSKQYYDKNVEKIDCIKRSQLFEKIKQKFTSQG